MPNHLTPIVPAALLLLCPLLAGCTLVPTVEPEPITIKAMTYNIWSNLSGEQLAKLIEASDAGIISLQEIGDGKALDQAAELLGPEWRAIYPGFNTRHLKQPPGRGERFWIGGHHMPAALITKHKVVEFQFYNITDTPEGWIDARIIECYRSCLRARLKVAEDQHVNVFSLHGNPWNGEWRIREFRDALGQLKDYHPDDPAVMPDDFNAVPHTDNPKDPNDAKSTKRLTDAGFIDTFRAAHPDPETHPGKTHKDRRIDHIYARNFEKVVASFVVGEPTFGSRDKDSDHQPLFTELTTR